MFSFQKAQPFDGIMVYEFPEELEGHFIIHNYELENQMLLMPSQIDLMVAKLGREFDLLVISELSKDKTEFKCYYSVALNLNLIDTSKIISNHGINSGMNYSLNNDTLCFNRFNENYFVVCDFRDTTVTSNYFRYDRFSFKDHSLITSGLFELVSDTARFEKQRFVMKSNSLKDTYYFNLFNNISEKWNIEVFKIQKNGNLKRYTSRLTRQIEKEDEIDKFLLRNNMDFKKEYFYKKSEDINLFEIDTNELAINSHQETYDSIFASEKKEELSDLEYLLNPSQEQFEELLSNPLFFNTFEFRRIHPKTWFRQNLILLLCSGLAIFFLIIIIIYKRRKKSIQKQISSSEKVYELISKGRIEKALSILKNDSLTTPLKKKIQLLEFNHKSANNKFNLGLLTQEELKKEEIIVTKAILDILKDEKENGSEQSI